MLKRVSSALVALALFGFIAGCSKSPVKEIEGSKAALESARNAEAELYAPELYKEAMDSLNTANVELQNQDSKFSLFRSYDRSKELLAAAEKLSLQAQTDAEAEKERIRALDSTMMAEIGSMVAQTREALAKAPKAKGSRADIKVLQADLEAAAASMTEISGDYNAGHYKVAEAKLEAIKNQVSTVKAQIDAALAKVNKK
jgi:hypothetical protein